LLKSDEDALEKQRNQKNAKLQEELTELEAELLKWKGIVERHEKDIR